MFKKLAKIAGEFQRLSDQLSDPATMKDQTLYKKLGKEHADLKAMMAAYQEHQQVAADIRANQELLGSETDGEFQKMIKEDLSQLESRKEALTAELKRLLIPKDPNDEKNVIMEIRAGTGGNEAALFAADLFRMYARYGETKGWRVEVTDDSPTDLGGFKEIIAIISGEKVYSQLKFESGIHRVQRVPRTEAQGRIHTSAISVSVLPEADDIEIDIEEKELRVDVFRASGPGGQGVNTTDSAVRITHAPSGIVVTCRDERSQIKNRAKAMKILKARLYEQKVVEQDKQIRDARRQHVGSGDRSEKIRTYNFPQNRVTDHRIGLTLHQLDQVLEGKLEELVSALTIHYHAESLKGESTP